MYDYGDGNSRRTDNEYPSPAGQSTFTLQLGDRVGQKTAESTSKTRRPEEESEPLLGLTTFVPPNRQLSAVVPLTLKVEDVHGNEVETARNDAGLSQTQEKTSGEEPRVALYETLSNRYASKSKHARGDLENNSQHPTWTKNIHVFRLRHTRGRKCLSSRLPGTSNKMYGTKLCVKG